MELKFGKDEVVLKSWNYAKAGSSFNKHKHEYNITVTNKRIVSSRENEFSLYREEIPLNQVHGIEGMYKKNDSAWTKVKLWLGIILCVALIGIPIVVMAVKELRACFLELAITTNGGSGDPLRIGGANLPQNANGSYGSRKSAKKVKFYVNKEMAKEILDEIGSVVLDNK